MDARLVKLQEIEKRYNEISDLLLLEENVTDPKKFTKLSKEQASLKGSYDAYQHLKALNQAIEEATAMLKDSDPEIKEMAEIELEEATSEKEALDHKIEELLLPKDPEDDNNCILEIRGAVGGDEANIFAGDLFRMYSYYADSLGYKIEVMEESPCEAGGYALISFMVKGLGAYRHFKFESGGHRVQRVPKTESQGRIQTSIATVYCLPEIEEEDFEIPDSDLTIETHRASGAGGQHINKTDSAVRIVHIPTGITVNCQEGRSQIENRETAIRIIRARVYEEMQKEKEEAAGKERRAKIGTGDRSEKIRTYNYPQNRVTDHRIHFSVNHLDQIMEGKLQEVIDALQAEEERRKLEVSE